MVLVNYTTRELTAKLVFYGPGLCGKTTNLQYIYDNLLPADRRGKMVSLSTETDRTLFFDFLPLDLGTIRGLKTRLQLYTVPGQVHYNATRKIVLKGADGIVFVADSQPSMRAPNIESYKNMKANLAEHGLDLKNVPHVFQFNKRDLADRMPVEQMEADLNEHNVPFFESSAVQGIGVEDTLRSITKLVLKGLAARFQGEAVRMEEKAPEAPTVPAVSAQPAAATTPVAPMPSAAPRPAPAPARPAPPPAARPAITPVAPVPVLAPALAPAAVAARAPQPAAPTPLRPSTPAPDVFSLDLEPAQVAAPVAAAAPEDEGEVLEVGEDAIVLEPEGDMGPGELSWELPGAAPPAALNLQDLVPPAAAPPPPVAPEARAPVAAPPPPEPFATPPPEPLPLELPGETISLDAGPLDDFPPLVDAPPVPAADLFQTAAPAAMSGPPPPPAPFDEAVLAGDTVLSVEGDLEGLATEADLVGAAPATAPPPAPGAQVPAPLAETPPAVVRAEPEPALAVARAEVLMPIELGQVGAGGLEERELRIPVDYTDASGATRRVTLEVTLRFRIG